MSEDAIVMLMKMFRDLGADEAQSETMARQLWKRAGQMAEEEEIDEVKALERLLKRMKDAQEYHQNG